MLGFVPSPVRGELLYSLIARWRAEIGFSAAASMRNWFGDPAVGVSLVVPKVGMVADRLPLRCDLDEETLAEEHTLLPYYSGFMEAGDFARARGSMLTRGIIRLAVTAGAPKRETARMLFCPECATDDVRNVRAATWRREHHIPGVLVCPEHSCQLRAGGFKGTLQEPCLVTPPDDLRGPGVENFFTRDGAARLARLARELADRSRLPTEKSLMAARFRRLLSGNGYLRQGGRIRGDRVQADLIRFYGERGLDAVGRGPGARNPFAWIGHLASDTFGNAGTPLPLLLVIGMLDYSWHKFEEPFRDEAHVRPGPRPRRPRAGFASNAKPPGFDEEDAASVRANRAASRNAVRRALAAPKGIPGDVGRPWEETSHPAATNAGSGLLPHDADRDALSLRMVKDAIARERAKSGPPVRMALLWLRRAAGLPTGDRWDAAPCTPVTDAFIRSAVESFEELRKRKIALAADAVRRSGVTPSWLKFLRLAVGGTMLSAPEKAAARLVYDGLPSRSPPR